MISTLQSGGYYDALLINQVRITRDQCDGRLTGRAHDLDLGRLHDFTGCHRVSIGTLVGEQDYGVARF